MQRSGITYRRMRRYKNKRSVHETLQPISCFGLFGFLAVMLVTGCASIDLPTVEKSTSRIERLNTQLERTERPLLLYEKRFAGGKDVSTALKTTVVNALLRALSSQRSDDLLVGFPPTRPLLQEKKSLFGITYSNRIDIDSGAVTLNLRSAEIVSHGKDELRVFLDLEGRGRIFVSGKYTGIPASSSPRIELMLRDTVSFRLQAAGRQGKLLLRPVRKEIMLRAILHVSLLGWEVPWEEEIPLQLEKILPEITLPSIVQTSIKLPVPAEEFSDKNYKFIETPITLTHSQTAIDGGIIRFDSDVVIK